jgi:hypothetical protein
MMYSNQLIGIVVTTVDVIKSLICSHRCIYLKTSLICSYSCRYYSWCRCAHSRAGASSLDVKTVVDVRTTGPVGEAVDLKHQARSYLKLG